VTEQQIRDLGPAFARYLDSFRDCFADHRAVEHLRAYCRGLLSDLPRKSVEPIALASGTAVRALQEFLRDYTWDHAEVRDRLQRRLAAGPGDEPDPLGTVGIVDETSAAKKGTKTPGVQRQYLGCVGKVANGIVTVHRAVTRGRFKALLDGELFLPESWDADRDRCAAAGIPDGVVYRPKWRIALDQVRRAVANGLHLDWVGFDEGYGGKPGFLAGLEDAGLTYAGEVPRDLPTAGGPAEWVVATDPAFTGQRWRAVRVPHQSEPDEVWEGKAARVHLRRDKRPTAGEYWLAVARSRRTAGVKYFASNAGPAAPVARVVRAAFARWNVEHAFRVAKSEAGMTHYEGRSYVGLTRHLTLCLVVMGFVAVRAADLRGEEPGGHAGAGVPGAQRPVRRTARPGSRRPAGHPHR
jgi:SRSO17 transposase